jgi:hypothetical protein
MCSEIEKPSRRVDIFEIVREASWSPIDCADVTRARAWHTISLREPCLLRIQSQMVVSSNSSAIYKFGKKCGKGSEHEHTCMQTKNMNENGALMFKYQMHNFDVAPVSQSAQYCSPPLVSAGGES